jgi:hypothetical protein
MIAAVVTVLLDKFLSRDMAAISFDPVYVSAALSTRYCGHRFREFPRHFLIQPEPGEKAAKIQVTRELRSQQDCAVQVFPAPPLGGFLVKYGVNVRTSWYRVDKDVQECRTVVFRVSIDAHAVRRYRGNRFSEKRIPWR